jgi:hypothetical protein
VTSVTDDGTSVRSGPAIATLIRAQQNERIIVDRTLDYANKDNEQSQSVDVHHLPCR